MRMKPSTIVIVLGGLCLASPSFAGDSTWLVCKGVAGYGPDTQRDKMHLVVSALEHRAASGDKRDLSITVLRGDHQSRGVVRNVEEGKPGKLGAKALGGNQRVTIDGRLTLASGMASIDLDGTIDPSFGADAKAKRVPFAAKLTCETLDDQAIGH